MLWICRRISSAGLAWEVEPGKLVQGGAQLVEPAAVLKAIQIRPLFLRIST
jgi:hypothetical protein